MTMRNAETLTTTPTPAPVDVLARLAQVAGLGALFVLGGLAVGCAVAIWRRDAGAILAGAAVGLASGGLAVLAMAARDVLSALEIASGHDLDGDGRLGHGDGAGLVLVRARGADAPADVALRDELQAFVNGCAVDTSARRWEPAIGRERYRAWRDRLIDGGWARWRGGDPRAGWELAADPGEIVKALG